MPTPRPAWAGSHSDGFPKPLRRRILRRHPICQQCGRRASTAVDHIIARAHGGTNDESNAQALCGPCHDAKTQHESVQGRGLAVKRPPVQHPGLRR